MLETVTTTPWSSVFNKVCIRWDEYEQPMMLGKPNDIISAEDGDYRRALNCETLVPINGISTSFVVEVT